MSETRRDEPLLPGPDLEPYAADVTASARDVAAALRERVPGLDVLRLHKFLYYCQGHHLATFGRPLFSENVFAWDNGPVVSTLRHEEIHRPSRPAAVEITSEAALNTIGYVLSRYGTLSPNDLINLTHGETPWRTANATRQPGDSIRIEREWMREYFSTEGAPGAGENTIVLDSRQVTDWLRNAEPPQDEAVAPDDLDRLRARLTARG